MTAGIVQQLADLSDCRDVVEKLPDFGQDLFPP